MIPGTVSTDPMRLCACVRSRFMDVVESCFLDGVKLVIIETARDAARQAYYVAEGVSKTLNSLHLPQPPFGLSLAVDAAPQSVLAMKYWAPWHADWKTYGAAAKAVGLEWGADWVSFKDYPHVQLRKCACVSPPAEPKVLEA